MILKLLGWMEGEAYEVSGKKKFNIQTWDEVEMSGQSCTYNGHLHTSPPKKKKNPS
jgi:hypothetical protein